MLGDFGTQESTIMHIIKGTISYLSKKCNTIVSYKFSCNKGGITESILKSLDDSQFKKHFYHSLESGLQKIKILSCKKNANPSIIHSRFSDVLLVHKFCMATVYM